MSVNPDYQRQGVDSMLMQLVCDEADRNDLDAFVISSPAGVRLYAKFGFKEAGAVETIHGKCTSMLRKARSTFNEKLKHAEQPTVPKLSPEVAQT
jgi:predicted acetyltransferase